MWNVKLSIYNVFQPDALNPSSARLSENQAVMCIGCIVSALTRTFEWKMALLSRITAVLYSTPSSLFDHAVCSSFFLSFFCSKIRLFPRLFPRLSLSYKMFPPPCQFFIPFDGVRKIGSTVRELEIFGGIFCKFRVRNIVNSFRRGSGKFETFENLSELNGEAVFFWQRIKRWSQFHEYLRNKRFGKKKKKRNEVEGNGKVITCFLQGKNFHKISLLNISKDKFKFVSLAIQVVNYIL